MPPKSLMGKFRDGLPVTQDAVTLILSTLDRIKEILDALEQQQREPDGADSDLIGQLDAMAEAWAGAAAGPRARWSIRCWSGR